MHINLKSRALRLWLYTGSMLRIRHFRGHGIHSPFAYSIVRGLMHSRIVGKDRALFTLLREHRCDKHSARQLQNFYTQRSYKSFSIINDEYSCDGYTDVDLIVIMNSVSTDDTYRIIYNSLISSTPVAAIYPRSSRIRYKICMKIINEQKCLSIDNRRFILFFGDNKYPHQHHKL